MTTSSPAATTTATTTTATTALVVDNLSKQYETPTEPLVVLREVSLRLCGNDSLAIVGPSGSGKSTLLNILGALDHPTAGLVTLAGVDPFKLNDADLAGFRSKSVGFIFQDHHLLPQCTALENVLLPKLAGGRVTDDQIARAKELLERVGVAPRAGHLPSELSGGERQRVAIARALMNGPQLLLCDEPTGNLDTANSRLIGELLTSIAAETKAILIVVTHSTALAQTFQHRMRMTDGRLSDET